MKGAPKPSSFPKFQDRIVYSHVLHNVIQACQTSTQNWIRKLARKVSRLHIRP